MEIKDFLKKASDQCGFIRETFSENNIPTNTQNICVLPFFGDMRSSCILSSLLLKRYKEEVKGSKYFILCSWNGNRSLYPYVDEYWSLKDTSLLKSFYSQANNFSNGAILPFLQILNQNFYEVIRIEEIEKYYKNGLTNEFIKRFPIIKRTFPNILSNNVLNGDVNKLLNMVGKKVFIHPISKIGKEKINKNFWINLANKILDANYIPVILQNYTTEDLNYANYCYYENNLSKILTTINSCDVVLDIFSGVSRLATLTRKPYVSCIERKTYMNKKEYELDDLIAEGLPRQYVFIQPHLITQGNEKNWKDNIFSNIFTKLNLLENTNVQPLPETTSYENVRKKKFHKMGIQFLKVRKD